MKDIPPEFAKVVDDNFWGMQGGLMSDGTTHYAGCIQAGPKHYECALQEIGRLRLTITDLRVKLEASKQEAEIHKLQAEKNYELGTEYFDLYTKAVRGQLKEKNGG